MGGWSTAQKWLRRLVFVVRTRLVNLFFEEQDPKSTRATRLAARCSKTRMAFFFALVLVVSAFFARFLNSFFNALLLGANPGT